MNSSTSPNYNGTIFDTNALSLIAKINRLDLLEAIAKITRTEAQLYITPAILNEVKAGIARGVDYLVDVHHLVEIGKLRSLEPNSVDQLLISRLPRKLAAEEAEAIALCSRLNLVLITHDRKAFNYCNRAGIACTRLTAIAKKLHNAERLTASEVSQMLS